MASRGTGGRGRLQKRLAKRGRRRIHRTIDSFSRAMGKHADELPAELVRTFVDGVALTLFRGLVLDTPRDTGRAAGNWQTTAGAPAQGVLEIRSMESAIGEAISRLEAARGDFDPVYCTNNLPYILPLEGGHSQQKPGGWIAVNIKRVTSALKGTG